MEAEHEHTPAEQFRSEFCGSVADRMDDENPRAWGGYALVQVCSCGAIRRVNIRDEPTPDTLLSCTFGFLVAATTTTHYEWGAWYDARTWGARP